MTKLRSIAGDGRPDEFRENLRRVQESMQTILESQAALAQITRARYDALLAAGFTKEQALELCK